ncbi:putative flippase GtrA [Hoeflea halophila]|uniref:Putative flippase GtrA n=1 Tax=Hoeflea halophila TaxID=714899 RepID=A0A286ICQ1_9HYPH|nr:GtrA family protein [Hoeflea halophila]SOE17851.1 putative flippase GtrA [Hoeflea halophila]
MKKLTFFLFAGAIGFVVDMGMLWLLIEFRMLDPFSARAPAIGAALFCTYMINRTFTFGASHRKVAVEGVRYGSVGLISTLINYCVYSGLLLTLPGLSPYIALILGSGSATSFAYLGYSRFVFGRGPDL